MAFERREITVSLSEMMHASFEGCLDLFTEQFFAVEGDENPYTLEDMSYEVVSGAFVDGMSTITLSVLGNIIRMEPVTCPACEESANVIDTAAECDSCGMWHRQGFTGDCRDDAERFILDDIDDYDGYATYYCVACKENFAE